jgi:mono/diheme cytochrome c family protein
MPGFAHGPIHNRSELIMKKSIVCGAAAILLTSLSAAMFSAAASHTRESAQEDVATSTTTAKADPVLVDRGRYLVRTAGCNDCHTPGYAASAGAVAENNWLTGDALGWEGAWGTTYPINLRLFMQSLTADQWLGIARQPARPPMPWFALRDMTDADLLAIYHYVRSLGPAGEHAPSFVPAGQPASTPVIKFPG